MKKVVVISIILIMAIISTTVTLGATKDNHWAKEYMDKLAERNALAENCTDPDQPITRGEACYILVNYAGIKMGGADSSRIIDITGHRYEEAIKICLTRNIVYGVSEHNFSPDEVLTRAQAAKILYNGFFGEPEEKYASYSNFLDVPKDHYALKHIAALKSLGIVIGVPGGNFEPDRKVTRGEWGTMTVRTDYILKTQKAGTEPKEDSETVQPGQNSEGDNGTVQPGQSSGGDSDTVQPGGSAGTSQPNGNTDTVQPGGNPGTSQPGGNPDTVQPLVNVTVQPEGNTSTVQPEQVTTQQPTGNTDTVQPGAQATQASGNTYAVQPNTQTTQSTGNPDTVQPGAQATQTSGNIYAVQPSGNTQTTQSTGSPDTVQPQSNTNYQYQTGAVPPNQNTTEQPKGSPDTVQPNQNA